MRMKICKIFGINLFDENYGDESLKDPKEIEFEKNENVQISSSAIYVIISKGNTINISSKLNNKEKQLEFKDKIRKFCHTNDNLFLLLEDGGVHKFDFYDFTLETVNCEGLNATDISCTFNELFVMTVQNQFYQLLPSIKFVFEFPRHQRIKKIVSGSEHTILMSGNGDLFSFGCGLRGCLGHGDVNSIETPQSIEALGGIKIIDVASGSFHSIAVSSFGDIYSWGWNKNGQLGLPAANKMSLKSAVKGRQQVFATPQLIELEDNVEPICKVFCGSQHSILKTERNRIFAAGLNNYGQLGLSNDDENVDKFTEMPLRDVDDNSQISCGCWSTFIINQNRIDLD